MAKANADAPPRVSVSMAEALERYLPHCDDNPHKVAARLDAQHREAEVQLLGGGVVMAPGANPSMLGVKAHIPPDGRAFLYVQVRKGLTGDYPIWDVGETVESSKKHHQFWAFERESFDARFPDAPVPETPAPVAEAPVSKTSTPEAPIAETPALETPVAAGPVPAESKNRGGRPVEFEVVKLLTEALVNVGVKGKLPRTATGQGGLHNQLKIRLGDDCPEHTRFNEIFGPIFQRIKDERSS